MGVVFAFSMTSQESANGTVFLGEACWTGLFPESGRGADETGFGDLVPFLPAGPITIL